MTSDKGHVGWHASFHVENVYWRVKKYVEGDRRFYTLEAHTSEPTPTQPGHAAIYVQDLDSVRRLAATLNAYVADLDSEGVSLTE